MTDENLPPSWATETMRIINELTPNIEGKAFDPDWAAQAALPCGCIPMRFAVDCQEHRPHVMGLLSNPKDTEKLISESFVKGVQEGLRQAGTVVHTGTGDASETFERLARKLIADWRKQASVDQNQGDFNDGRAIAMCDCADELADLLVGAAPASEGATD